MMDTDRLRDAVEALLVADPECLDGGELTAVVAAASELRGLVGCVRGAVHPSQP